MSDYEYVTGGPLKLKKDKLGLSEKSKKLKKKKKNNAKAENILDKIVESSKNITAENEANSNSNSNDQIVDNKSWMTEAQKKFLAQQEKRQLERVMAKASKTHKQRVEEFNSNLEKLSEHYDIPKVSWTK